MVQNDFQKLARTRRNLQDQIEVALEILDLAVNLIWPIFVAIRYNEGLIDGIIDYWFLGIALANVGFAMLRRLNRYYMGRTSLMDTGNHDSDNEQEPITLQPNDLTCVICGQNQPRTRLTCVRCGNFLSNS